MTFPGLIQDAMNDAVNVSLGAFWPELALCGTIVALLLAGMVTPRWRRGPFLIALVGIGLALFLVTTGPQTGAGGPPKPEPVFTGLLVYDSFSILLRGLLLAFGLLFVLLTLNSGVPEAEDATEFYVLVLGALVGMCLVVSANHMLIVFLGVEMMSVPSYVLAGFLRQRRQSTEAAFKYAVFGAACAGVMLYGISLLVGALGSAQIPVMARRLAETLSSENSDQLAMVLVLGGLMLGVGLAFKLSAVPFHFWAPDVFEGAPAEVGALLSVASKTAALALLVRLALGFSYLPEAGEPVQHAPAQVASLGVSDGAANAQGPQRAAADAPQGRPLLAALEPARTYLTGLIALLAAVTCTFGNLAAYGQTNLKRLLAYSTIAHAGYMMMAVAAAVAVAGRDPEAARFAVASLVAYLAVYLFMNLGAFAVVAFVRNATGGETMTEFAGLVRRSPALALSMAVILFSLVGLPPLAGFLAKFWVFAALVDSGLYYLLVIGGLNTVLSLFYYLRVVRVMVLDEEPTDRPAPTISLASPGGAFCAIMALPLLLLIVFAAPLFAWAQAAASSLLW